MPIEIADAVGRLAIAVPPQVLLHRNRGGTVGLLAHDGLVSHHAGRRKGLGGRTGHAEQGAEDGIAEAHGDFAHAASAVGIPTQVHVNCSYFMRRSCMVAMWRWRRNNK